MNKDIVSTLVGVFWGLMPLWITLVVNPLWSIGTKKVFLICLFVLYNLLLVNILTRVTPKSFSDTLTQNITIVMFFLHWTLTLFRIYQLWPRQKK
jgi:hypothetical protein